MHIQAPSAAAQGEEMRCWPPSAQRARQTTLLHTRYVIYPSVSWGREGRCAICSAFVVLYLGAGRERIAGPFCREVGGTDRWYRGACRKSFDSGGVGRGRLEAAMRVIRVTNYRIPALHDRTRNHGAKPFRGSLQAGRRRCMCCEVGGSLSQPMLPYAL